MDNTAVLEKPVSLDGSPPPFDDAAWEEKMGAVGGPEPAESNGPRPDDLTLKQVFGLPESLENRWPDHGYLPPRMKQIERILALAEKTGGERTLDMALVAVDDAVAILTDLVFRIEGEQTVKVTADEVKAEFAPDEIGELCRHILEQEGVLIPGVSGNSPSGRRVGLMSFQPSAALTRDTESNTSESLPSDSSPE